ncbi:SIP domain-containing protein [Streptomyces sp. NPDC049879]|uniref:SIP domain-containing protein n=1 Tax=Streptomyces sp. NPDC049879 TaxID=3365598 RepID=UPI0037B22764
MSHHDVTVHPLVLRRTEVARVADVTPRMRRITVTGPQLGSFERDGMSLPGFASPAFDDHVKLVFASDGDVRAVLPRQVEGGIEWAPAATRQGRDFTPRRFDPEALELDLDFVRHGDGPAAVWARHARPGDELWFAGPKASTVVPPDSPWVLLAGDETALPAIGRYFEERPVDAPVRAVVTVPGPAARQDLAVRPEDRVTWVVAEPGDPAALAAAVAAVEPLDGVPYVWAAAESRSLLPVRRHAARVLGTPKTRQNITGYWHLRSGTGAPPAPVAWFAVRAALRLGVPDALAPGPLDGDVLARRVGVEPARLAVLLDALVTAGVVAHDASGRVGLGPAGEELAEDDHARERYTGLHADRIAALAELPAALTGTTPAWQAAHGLTLRETAARDTARYAELVEDAEGLAQLVTGLPRHPVWGRARRVGVTGPGALSVADVLHGHAAADVTVVEAPAALAALRAEARPDCPHAFAEDWGTYDAVATALALGHRTDDEAATLLRALRTAAPVAVLVERLAPDGLSPAALSEGALLHLATLGTPPRTPDRFTHLAATAGWTVTGRRKLGWGVGCVELAAAGTAP